MPGRLFIVATPIGNLEDTSERVKNTLAASDAILCEDTRVTSKLLARFSISKPLIPYHQHSSDKTAKEIIARLEAEETLSLVTDAGTPGISDPGGRLVEQVLNAAPQTTISPIPGPSAVIAALSISGFPADRFHFLGFPPVKRGRAGYFDALATSDETQVFYESTHRILKTLSEIDARMPERSLVVCRELTKLHETIYRGTASEVTEQLNSTSIKGEFVLVLRA